MVLNFHVRFYESPKILNPVFSFLKAHMCNIKEVHGHEISFFIKFTAHFGFKGLSINNFFVVNINK